MPEESNGRIVQRSTLLTKRQRFQLPAICFAIAVAPCEAMHPVPVNAVNYHSGTTWNVCGIILSGVKVQQP